MSLAPDIRFAVRALRRQPAFAAAVTLTLALGIGTSTAVFSLLDAALLRPLPFESPSRVTWLSGVAGPERSIRRTSYLDFNDLRASNRSFTAMSVYNETSLNLRTGTEAVRVNAEMVSASYFDILGARAERGRTFAATEDEVPDRDAVAVISANLWTTRFGGDPAIVGRVISLNERPFTVIGVMPSGFHGLSFDSDAWVTVAMVSVNRPASQLASREQRWLNAIGRLRDGVTLDDARRDLDGIAAQLAQQYPASNAGRGVELLSLTDNYLGSAKPLLLALFGAVLLFLLIACANVTSLQLVRATARQREMTLRVALGADRRQLLQQLLVEGAVLALIGAAAGSAFAFGSVRVLLPMLPEGALPLYVHPAIDLRALAFSGALAIVCGLAFGLAPAAHASRLDLTGVLKAGGRTASGGLASIRTLGAQQLLVVGEVALALVLLLGAGLLVRSVRHLLAVDPGFGADAALTAQLELPDGRFAPAERVPLVAQIEERLRAIPGVASVGVGSDAPLNGSTSAGDLVVEGGSAAPTRYYRHRVTPDYFAALQIPLVSGRLFTRDDRLGTLPVAVVSENMAKRFWPSGNAVGQRIRPDDGTGPVWEIVGVVRTARFRDLTSSLADPRRDPDVYFPYAQSPSRSVALVIRAAVPPASLAREMRRVIASLDADLPLYGETPMAALVDEQTATSRFGSLVLSVFSSVALLLAAVGIYGMLAFVTGLSQREIAIRVALGATGGQVLALVVARGMFLVSLGLGLGLIASLFATEAIEAQLFGVSATDPATFAGVASALFVVALIATYLPARRVLAVDPQLALRAD